MLGTLKVRKREFQRFAILHDNPSFSIQPLPKLGPTLHAPIINHYDVEPSPEGDETASG
jgi:hypothetical protein